MCVCVHMHTQVHACKHARASIPSMHVYMCTRVCMLHVHTSVQSQPWRTLSISYGDYHPLSPISSSPSPCPPAPATERTGATRVTFNLPHPCASPSSALRLSSVRGRLDGVTGTLRPGAGPDSTGNVTVSVLQLTRGGCPEGHRWCQRCPGVCVCLWLCLYVCVCLFLFV